MKTAIKAVAIATLLAFAAPLGAAADETMVKGEVTKVDPDAGKITIKHDPIKKFDMDAMTMVFRAGDPFHPDKVNGQFTVTKIEKAK